MKALVLLSLSIAGSTASALAANPASAEELVSISLATNPASAEQLASLPLAIRPAGAEADKTDQDNGADIGVMGVNLKDAVKLNYGFQGALQGAGTPNKAGIGGFLPLVIGDNSVFFLDAQANANFADFNEYSSIINTKVAGTTISTSSRLGYRWLNGDRSLMFGVNAGYDSRPLATGGTDTGVYVTNSSTVFFQQVALNLEAVSNKWSASAYLLYPIGEYGFNKTPPLINSFYSADSVMTVGADIGYNLTPNLKASVGYYYSEGDVSAANGNSVKGRLEYNIANGLTTGINIAYDPAYSKGYSSDEFYKTLNLSADLKYRFGANGYGAPSIRNQQPVVMPVIQALSASPENRDVRIHDCDFFSFWSGGCNKKMEETFAPLAAVIVGVASDVNTLRDPGPGTGVSLVGGAFATDQGAGITSLCNGYFGKLWMNSLGQNCDKSVRTFLEQKLGTYIPDNELYKYLDKYGFGSAAYY